MTQYDDGSAMADQSAVGPEPFHKQMRRTMESFTAAWARGDIDGLMALFGDNPIYRTSSGAVFEGRVALREGLLKMCPSPADDSLSSAVPARIHFFDRLCLTYWQMELANGDTKAIVEGVDVITFDDRARLIVKDAYRKLT